MTSDSSKQQQFLNVIDRDEAERRWRAAFSIPPEGCGVETVPLSRALGRILADDVVSLVDVPFFDRSNLDGFAVQAANTYGADEEHPVRLRLLDEVIATAVVPEAEINDGEGVAIATGGMLPRGADAIVMVEHTDIEADRDGRRVVIYKPVTPGRGLTYAGTDISKGETVYRRGDLLTSRETGVLAAIGAAEVLVRKKPRVGIVSTGDEIIQPSETMRPGLVFDSNAQVLADAVQELGGEPVRLGIVADDAAALRDVLQSALADCDIVLMSGGTSKGAGDISYKVVSEFDDPGIVAHGVALKPGKPICLAATQNTPVVILPGFPTSAIFTFHEFVASVILQMAGQVQQTPAMLSARLATQVNSEIGRTEYLLVGVVRQRDEQNPLTESPDCRSSPLLSAYPMGKGSGSVTAFSRADGFVTIDRHCEIIDEGSVVSVTLLGRDLHVADLVCIGSHCVGLDFLLGELQRMGIRSKFMAVGSTAGLSAVQRGECDVAGIHLLDPATDTYNSPFLTDDLELIRGYTRRQGLVFRRDDDRFAGRQLDEIVSHIVVSDNCVMVNRNQGSGTRILLDDLLGGRQPRGYAVQSRSHNAVVASVAQGRSDWGMAIEIAAKQGGLGFLPVRDEQFDFVVSRNTTNSAVAAFRDLLQRSDVRAKLTSLGLS